MEMEQSARLRMNLDAMNPIVLDSRYESVMDRFHGVVEDVYAQAEGAAPDPYMQAFYRRLLPELTRGHDVDNEFLLYTLLESLRRNPDATPGHMARNLFQVAQYMVIPPFRPDTYTEEYDERHRQPDYPNGRDMPEGWDDIFDILKHDAFGRYIFREHLVWELIQANDAQRGFTIRAMASLVGLKGLKIYSGGCSLGNVEKLIGLYDGKAFTYHLPNAGQRTPEGEFVASPALTHRLGQLATSPQVRLGPSLGVDLAPPTFVHSLNWAWSNTLRPSYLLNPSVRAQTERLITTDVANLRFFRGNFTLPDHPQHLRRQYPRWRENRFNLALYVTSLYQNDEEKKQKAVLFALRNAEKLTASDGIIAVQDFVHLDSGGDLEFANNWREWDYNLYIWDKANTKARWQHIFSMRDPRVMTDVALGKDLQRKFEETSRLSVGMLREAV